MYVISMLHLISIVAALLVCALIATQFAALSNVHSRDSSRTLPGTRFQPLRFATAGSAFVGGLASSNAGTAIGAAQTRRACATNVQSVAIIDVMVYCFVY